jgi:RNA polymerase sigma factor (sigma-70 family)
VSQIDARQLRQIVASHAAALALYARQWCRYPDDAVQEALIELVKQMPPPDDPIAWLFTATRRRAQNQSRSEQRRAQHQQRAAASQDAWFDVDPVNELAAKEVEAMLQQLEPLDREIIVARLWGDMSFEQIAALVQRSTSVVHRHYHAALSLLSRKLNPPAPKAQKLS